VATESSIPGQPVSEELFAQLLTRHRAQIFRLIFSMVHSLQDAEDVFQDSTLTMWDNFHKFDPNTDFAAWAAQIARHKALNLITSSHRRKTCFSPELINELAHREEPSHEIQQARLRALEQCRTKLRASDQQLLKHCYGGDGKIREAADRLGRPAGSVYDSLMRIRRTLMECVRRALAGEGIA
jgi:RNA polymerase sigma-70 factor (ECF subfamily)